MPVYLLDTNVLLRLVNATAEGSRHAAEAVARILRRNEECFLTPQVLIEFWCVATRPMAANGLGWDPAKVRLEIDRLLYQFPLLEETPAIFDRWLAIVTSHGARGKRVHDVRLIAVMQTHHVTHLLTFNTGDFPPTPDVTLVHPEQVR